jgi:uncharacterized protein (TIGR03437 family)
MTKKLLALLAGLMLWSAPTSAQPSLVIDPSVDQSKYDFELWRNVVAVVHDNLTKRLNPYVLTITASPNLTGTEGTGCGRVNLYHLNPPRVFAPTVKSDISDPFYTPDWELSRVVFFTNRDQPQLKAVTNAATFKQGPVVPGSIATLFTWGATQGDPEFSATTPLPTASCGGRTQAVFTGSNGRIFPAPLFYCGQSQSNVQVPNELRGPTARVKVRLNETDSNELAVQVTDVDPSIFLVDPAAKTGAVIFLDGGPVNSSRPARAGDIVSVFATGLGAVSPPLPPTGSPAPFNTLYNTTAQVAATIGGINAPVLFAGLAPGFVGLYQINLQVPDKFSTGTGVYAYPLSLAMEGSEGRKVSNEVMLAIQRQE